MNPGDLTTLENVKAWLSLTGLQISAISNASPAVITLAGAAPSPPLLSGLTYDIAGVTGTAGVDGSYVITVLSPTTFSIPVDTTANGTYTGGGVVGVSDPIVQRLISAGSAFMQNLMSRSIASATYTRSFNGEDMPTMILPETPVTAINALQVDGIDVAARAPLVYPSVTGNGWGYTYQSNGQVALTGYVFARGYNNVYVSWDGGYRITDEAQTVPAIAPYTLTTITRWSAGNISVKYAATGVLLTEVTGAPAAAGEYAVDGSVYTFSAADAGVAVLLTYAMVPFDVEQACIDMIGDWFVYRSRIGILSKAIEGQSITFTNTALPVRARDVIRIYSKPMTLS